MTRSEGHEQRAMRIGEAVLAAGRTEFEAELLECNRVLGQAIVDIGCAVGLRAGASVAEIKARVAELMRFTDGQAIQ